MSWRRISNCFFLIASLSAMTVPVARAAPFSITYGGRISDATGKPATGPVDLEIKFFDDETAGNQVGPTKVLNDVVLRQGVFQIEIDLTPGERDVVFGAVGPVYVEVKHLGLNKKYPRQTFSAVPYALRVPVDGTTIGFNGDGELEVKSISGVPQSGVLLDGGANDVTIKAATGSDPLTLTLPDTVGTSGYVLTTDGVTGALTWTSKTSAGGGDMLSTNNLGDVASPATARLNLGLGNVANTNVLDTFTQNDAQHLGTDEVRARDAGGLKLSDDAGNGVFVQDGGNVGVGTTSPGAKLQVQQNDGVSNIQLAPSGGYDPSLKFFRDTNASVGIGRIQWNAKDSSNVDQTYSWVQGSVISNTAGSASGGIDFITQQSGVSTQAMRIAGGNVGIGTAAPGDKLQVEGKIRAQQVCYTDGTNCKDLTVPWAAGSLTSVGINPPAAGMTASADVTGAGGDITLTLANDLAAVEGLGGTGLAKRTAADTWTTITDNSTNWDSAYTDRLKWDGGATGLNATTAKTSLGLVIGTNVQAQDAGLQSIADLTTAANQMIYTTAADTYTTTGLTSFGRDLLDDTSVAAQQTTLGLGSMATQAASSVAITGGTMSGVTISGGSTSNFTSTGIDDNADALAMTINSSEFVGIGTTSPQGSLHVARNTVGGLPTGFGGNSGFIVQNNDTTGRSNDVTMIAGTTGQNTINFADSSADYFAQGRIVYDQSSDFMTQYTAGVERTRLTSAGNLGIGITNPERRLVIQDSANTPTFTGNQVTGARISGTTANGNYSLLGFGASFNTGNLAQIGAKIAGTGSLLQFGTSNNYATGITNTAMTIDEAGEVGIGNESPVAPLHVTGATILDGGEVWTTSINGSSNLMLYNDTATAGNGNFGASLDFGGPAQGFVNGPRASIVAQQDGADGDNVALAVYTHPSLTNTDPMTEAMRVSSQGDVGVGVTSPAAKLDVAGAVKLGASATACSATTVGSLRYDTTTSGVQFCRLVTGSTYAWVTLGRRIESNITITVADPAGFGGDDCTLIQSQLDLLSEVTIAKAATVTIQLPDGTYNCTTSVSVELIHGRSVRMIGNQTTPASVELIFTNVAGLQFYRTNFAFLDGMTISRAGVSGAHVGLDVGDGSSVTLGTKMVIRNFSLTNETCLRIVNNSRVAVSGPSAGAYLQLTNCMYGVTVDRGSGFVGAYTRVTGVSNASAQCFYSANASSMYVQNSQASTCLYGYVAYNASGIEAASSIASSSNVGFASSRGSYIGASSATSSSNAYGFQATLGATLEANSAVANSNTQYGFYAVHDSNIYAISATANSNTVYGFAADQGSHISASGSTATGNGTAGWVPNNVVGNNNSFVSH